MTATRNAGANRETQPGSSKGTNQMRFRSLLCTILLLVIAGLLLAGCASYEKRINLSYDPTLLFKSGDGEVDVAGPIIDVRLTKLPGGKVALGTVKESITQIVTADNVSEWVRNAVLEELYHAGYKVNAVPSLSPKARKTVLLRLVSLSGNQYSDGLILSTYTQIGLSADIWKEGRLLKTLTATAGGEQRGIDRSAAPVSRAFKNTLQSVLEQLVPDIISTLES